jgi:hypothetical protein
MAGLFFECCRSLHDRADWLDSMQRFWNTWRVPLLCALLGALTLALYWPVTHYSFIGYDDPDYVTDNPRVQSGLSWANVAWAVPPLLKPSCVTAHKPCAWPNTPAN